MIPVTVRIFVYTEPVDMRRGFRAVFELPVSREGSAVSVRIDGQKLATLLAGRPKERKRRGNLRLVR